MNLYLVLLKIVVIWERIIFCWFYFLYKLGVSVVLNWFEGKHQEFHTINFNFSNCLKKPELHLFVIGCITMTPTNNIMIWIPIIHTWLLRFGMTDEQAVALMGAHTLGYAHRQNSGFRNVNCFLVFIWFRWIGTSSHPYEKTMSDI